MSKITLAENEEIVAVQPWRASGPGWSGYGAHLHIRDLSGKFRVECVQGRDFGQFTRTLFDVAETTARHFARAITEEHTERRKNR